MSFFWCRFIVGKKVELKIFCTNENFKYSLDDSGRISKKVRRKVASSDIEPYTVKAIKKMVPKFIDKFIDKLLSHVTISVATK